MTDDDPQRPRRRVAHWLLRRLPAVAVVCAATSVLLGIIGYLQFRPDAGLTDVLYSAVRLLIVDGPDGTVTSSPPLVLDIARFLALGASGVTFAAVVLRSGTARSDLARARRSRHHLVVFGSTDLAERLAVARSTQRSSRGSATALVGDPGDDHTAALRHQGIAVVTKSNGRRLVAVLSGADGVLIAEDSDEHALDQLHAVRRALIEQPGGPPARPIDVRVVLHSSDLARLLRAQVANNPDRYLEVTAVSNAEAVAAGVVRHPWSVPPAQGTRDHVIVVGDGDTARLVATTAAERRMRRGEPLQLSVLAPDDAAWPREVGTRVESDTVRVELRPGPLAPDWVSRIISELIEPNDFVQVYVVGLPDADLYSLGHRIATRHPGLRVVTVLAVERLPEYLLAVRPAPGTEWLRPLVPQLVSEPGALDLGVAQQLAELVLRAVRQVVGLPGHEALGNVLRSTLESTDRGIDWSRTVARSLLGVMRTRGCQVGAGRTDVNAVLGGQLLIDVRREFTRAVEAIATGHVGDGDMRLLQRVVADLPSMFAEIGMELVVPADGSDLRSIVELLAPKIHEQYCVTALRAGSASPLASLGWDELTEAQREQNRAQARDIPSKLADLGFVIAEDGGMELETVATHDVEAMARNEHARWMLQRISSGWAFGPRDDAKKLHNLIIEYERLEPAQWELDREPTQGLPQLLSRAGLRVRRA